MNAADTLDRDRQITVGAYRLIRLPDGTIWIAHKSGEGGQFAESSLELAIARFFYANF